MIRRMLLLMEDIITCIITYHFGITDVQSLVIGETLIINLDFNIIKAA